MVGLQLALLAELLGDHTVFGKLAHPQELQALCPVLAISMTLALIIATRLTTVPSQGLQAQTLASLSSARPTVLKTYASQALNKAASHTELLRFGESFDHI